MVNGESSMYNALEKLEAIAGCALVLVVGCFPLAYEISRLF
jgi:hypothetical protein